MPSANKAATPADPLPLQKAATALDKFGSDLHQHRRQR